MKNFGKFNPVEETVVVYGQEVKIIFQRNEEGEDLVEVLKAHPHPFYIAVDKEAKIVSMVSDPETIQIGGHDIIGIDSDFGFTHGEGGNVYGAIWNGVEIVAPPEPVLALTARQFWLAALELGITEQGLLASIVDEEDPLYIADELERAAVAIDIAKATSFRRDYSLVDSMAAAFGLPAEQMDDLWAWAAQIE